MTAGKESSHGDDHPQAKPDPEALYEPIQPVSTPDHGVLNPGRRLRGDHPAVRAHFGAFMLAELPDDEKGRIRSKAIWGAAAPATSGAPPPPVAGPPTGRFRALRSWTLPDPELQHRARINAGDIVDADDEVFRRYSHLFVQHIEER